MQNPRLAFRYAKSLIDIAQEQNALDAVLADMTLIDRTCKASRDFTLMLRSPVVKGDKKKSIIHAVFQNSNFQQVTQSFIDLLVNKSREANLPEIADAFIGQYKDLKQINAVYLTTAVPLSDDVMNVIRQKIGNTLQGDVELHTKVDADILGGFILEVKDKAFDASIRRDLNDIGKQFEQNLFVASI